MSVSDLFNHACKPENFLLPSATAATRRSRDVVAQQKQIVPPFGSRGAEPVQTYTLPVSRRKVLTPATKNKTRAFSTAADVARAAC